MREWALAILIVIGILAGISGVAMGVEFFPLIALPVLFFIAAVVAACLVVALVIVVHRDLMDRR